MLLIIVIFSTGSVRFVQNGVRQIAKVSSSRRIPNKAQAELENNPEQGLVVGGWAQHWMQSRG